MSKALIQDFCSPSFFLLSVGGTAPPKHACTRSHTRTGARARISVLGTCTTRSSPGSSGRCGREVAGTWGRDGGAGPAGKGAQGRRPPPAGCLSAFPLGFIQNGRRPHHVALKTPARPRPPPHRFARGPLHRLLHISTRRFIVLGAEGEEKQGREEGGGEVGRRGQREGGRERERERAPPATVAGERE